MKALSSLPASDIDENGDFRPSSRVRSPLRRMRTTPAPGSSRRAMSSESRMQSNNINNNRSNNDMGFALDTLQSSLPITQYNLDDLF